jgi:hypothetical protein
MIGCLLVVLCLIHSDNPHIIESQEERFLFVIYPLLCLCAAVGWRCWSVVMRSLCIVCFVDFSIGCDLVGPTNKQTNNRQ